MPVFRPFADLRHRAREPGELCHDSDEPVLITKNGEGDLVLTSLAAYERLQARLELYSALEEAEADERAGDRGVTVGALRRKLR